LYEDKIATRKNQFPTFMKNHSNQGWLFMLPAIGLLTVVGVIPLLTVINYSFHDIF